MTLRSRLSLRVFASSDPMRRDTRRILPQCAADRALLDHARASRQARLGRAAGA